MKFLFTLLLSIALATTAHAQKEIKASEAQNHVGDSVTITGSIMGARFLQGSNGRPSLLNLGAAYPNQHLTLVIWGENRSQFQEAPEIAYNNKLVKVSGRIELFKGKPQMIIKSEKQITVLPDTLTIPPVIKD